MYLGYIPFAWLPVHLVHFFVYLVFPGRKRLTVHPVMRNVQNIDRHGCKCRRPLLDHYRRPPDRIPLALEGLRSLRSCHLGPPPLCNAPNHLPESKENININNLI